MFSASTIGLIISCIVFAVFILKFHSIMNFLSASAVLMSQSAPRSELDLALEVARPAH